MPNCYSIGDLSIDSENKIRKGELDKHYFAEQVAVTHVGIGTMFNKLCESEFKEENSLITSNVSEEFEEI